MDNKKKHKTKEEPKKGLSWVCVMDCGKFKRGAVISDLLARSDKSFNLRYFVRSK